MIQIKVTGLDEARASRSAIGARARDLRSVYQRILRDLRQMEVHEFASEGSFFGEAWSELSPAYAAWKRKRFPGRKILVRTGRLRSSVVQQTGDSIAEVSKKGLVFGTLVEYAGYHDRCHAAGDDLQFGDGASLRPFLGMTEEMDDRYSGWISDYILGPEGVAALRTQQVFEETVLAMKRAYKELF